MMMPMIPASTSLFFLIFNVVFYFLLVSSNLSLFSTLLSSIPSLSRHLARFPFFIDINTGHLGPLPTSSKSFLRPKAEIYIESNALSFSHYLFYSYDGFLFSIVSRQNLSLVMPLQARFVAQILTYRNCGRFAKWMMTQIAWPRVNATHNLRVWNLGTYKLNQFFASGRIDYQRLS